ncbi:MAG: DUF3164 family protein [Spirochaetes bacterium]|nr:DUF3164 family protein [Spirochaetota bacterium]MBN2771240.1 DUF3164 family protein [Spirochaetota bacterium]
MTKKIPEGYKEDSKGRLIPVNKIQPIDLERDTLVKQVITDAKTVSSAISRLKKDTTKELDLFLKRAAKNYKTKFGGKKGNLTLYSYDGQFKITHTVSDRITFDERLQIAKQLVDECISNWSKGSNENIKLLINDAFYVDKQGKINKEKILGLRRLKIKDTKWKHAMQAIDDSIQVVDSKPYIRCYERTEAGDYKQINLDMATA